MSKSKKKKEFGKARTFSAKPASPTVKTPFVPGSHAPGSGDRRLVFGICIFLAAIVWLVFGQAVHFTFVNYDDNAYVYENPAVMGGLSWNGVKWAFTHTVALNWHPLTMLSHMLDCQLYGLNAGGHHLTNILLHTASVIVLFLVLQQMTDKLWRSAMVAAVFAIHPLHVESVAWVAERKDVLSGLFFMLTLWAYARYARRPFSLGRYLWVVVLFTLGLLSKPMLVTLPFVLLLLDYWPLGRFQLTTFRGTFRALRPLLLEKIPLFLLSAVLSIATFIAQKNFRMTLENLPLASRFSNAIVSYGIYVWEMIWPQNLAVFYPPMPAMPIWQIVIASALLLIITAMAIWLARRRAYVLVGWLWYLGMLVPVIGLVQVGSQSHADRYTYLPQIGLYVLLIWGAADLCARWRHRRMALGAVSMMILVGLIFCARAQTSYWQNSESLWTHSLACTPDNALAENNLGDVLSRMGREDEAMIHLQRAVQINPRFAKAYFNLGNLSLQRGRNDEAMGYFQQALQIDPRYAEAHNNLGYALYSTGHQDEAMAQFQQALQIDPDDTVAHNDLGSALLSMGRDDEAIVQFRQVLQINPDDTDAHLNLGKALIRMGQEGEAMAYYKRALQINPRSLNIQNDLAWVLATVSPAALRDGPRAVELAEQANQNSGGGDPIILRTLAAAYAEAGRFDDAVRTAQKAIVLARATGQSGLVEQLDAQLNLYAAKHPFHQDSKQFED